jgi:hypothetical protein
LKNLLLHLLFLLPVDLAAQDSTEIKLQHYKDLYNKKLINSYEYELLKYKALDLSTTATFARKLTFNVQIVPTGYFDFSNNSVYANNGTGEQEHVQSGGIEIEAGPSFKGQFMPNLAVGVEGLPGGLILPVFADFNFRPVKKSVSPVMHVGIGYASAFELTEGVIMDNLGTGTVFNGALVVCGMGVSVRASQLLSITVSPDYRFLYFPYTLHEQNYQTGLRYITHEKDFENQLGLRVAFTFS